MRRIALSACLLAFATGAHAQPAPAASNEWVVMEGGYCWQKTSPEAVTIAEPPPSDDAARAYAWDHRHDLTPLCSYEAAVAWADADADKAAELYALAKIRGRYDVLRCKTPEAEGRATAMFKTFDANITKLLGAKRPGEARWLSETIKRVAMTDEAFAYDGRRLRDVCAASGVGSRSTWNSARYSIRTTIAATP